MILVEKQHILTLIFCVADWLLIRRICDRYFIVRTFKRNLQKRSVDLNSNLTSMISVNLSNHLYGRPIKYTNKLFGYPKAVNLINLTPTSEINIIKNFNHQNGVQLYKLQNSSSLENQNNLFEFNFYYQANLIAAAGRYVVFWGF